MKKPVFGEELAINEGLAELSEKKICSCCKGHGELGGCLECGKKPQRILSVSEQIAYERACEGLSEF